MSDDSLTPEEQRTLDRVFDHARPCRLEGDWESTLRQEIAASQQEDAGRALDRSALDESGKRAAVVELEPRRAGRWRPSAEVLVRAAVLLVLVGGAFTAWRVAAGDGDGTPIEGVENVEDGTIAIGDARLTIRSDGNSVLVNGDQLPAGSFQEGAAGDLVEVDANGVAVVTAESVLEIEALRGTTLTVPELISPIDVALEQGHIDVQLDPAAQVTVTIDVGERQFISRTPDASFSVCHTPDGASCLAVLRGEVEWFEDGVSSEFFQAGQASFAARGNLPDPPRCADELAMDEMRRMVRDQQFTGVLANIVDTWELCDLGGAPTFVAGTGFPSAAGMERVVAPEITIGSPDVAEDTESIIAERTVEGSADFYIEPLAVTNSGFRTWLVATAGDDGDSWRQHAPQDWLDRAPGGSVTQAIYAAGAADEAVRGVSFSTAADFCAAQAKRLPTEIEWELAAVAGVIGDLADEAQDWVTDWEAYGPGPDDVTNRQVLRGTDAVLAADPYFRIFAVTDPEWVAARQSARIRCAADEVAIGGQTFPNVVLDDDFNTLEWPTVTEEFFELDYHPENYHLDLTVEHSQVAVVRRLDQPLTAGRVDVDLFIDRNNTGADTGAHRFGVVVGSADQLVTLTVQPDEFTGDRFLACLLPVGPELAAELALNGANPSTSDPHYWGAVNLEEGHYGEDCIGAESPTEVPVASIDVPVRLSLVVAETGVEAWVNDHLVAVPASLPTVDTVGFYGQLYHRPRTHIHIDALTVSSN